MGAALSIPASHRAAPKTLSAANDCYSEIMLGGLTTACLSRDGLARMMLQDCLMARDSAQSQNPAQPKLIFASNGHVIAMARDEAFRTLLAKADVIHADGQAMVFVSHLTRTPIPERSATTDFLHDASKVAARYGLRFFLLGATEEANAEAAHVKNSRIAQARFVGKKFDLVASSPNFCFLKLARRRPLQRPIDFKLHHYRNSPLELPFR